MAKKSGTAIRLPDEIREALDRAAADFGVKRSALIRTILSGWLKRNHYL